MTARAHPLAATAPHHGGSVASYSTIFAVVVAAYLLVILGRVHEIIPALQPLRLGMLTSLVMAFAAVRVFRVGHLRHLFSSTGGRAFLIMTAMVFLTVPTGAWPSASANYIRSVYFQMAILFIATALLFVDRRAGRLVIVALVAEVSIAGLVPIILGSYGRYGIGSTYDQNETASLFALMIPWALYVAVTERGWKRVIGIAAMPLYLYGILKTGSRGGLLGVGAMVPFLIYLSPPRRRIPFITVVVLAAMGTFAALDEQAIRRFRRAFDTTEYNYTTEDGRINIWKRGLGYIRSKPLQGVGINGFQYQELKTKTNTGYGIRQAAAHNMYIQVAAELGVIGFSAFLVMIAAAWLGCTRVRRRLKPLALGRSDPAAQAEILRANMAQAALLSVLFTGFFLSLGYSAMLFFSVAAAIGIGLGGGHVVPMPSGAGSSAARPSRGGRALQRGWRSVRSRARFAGTDSPPSGA